MSQYGAVACHAKGLILGTLPGVNTGYPYPGTPGTRSLFSRATSVQLCKAGIGSDSRRLPGCNSDDMISLSPTQPKTLLLGFAQRELTSRPHANPRRKEEDETVGKALLRVLGVRVLAPRRSTQPVPDRLQFLLPV
eukprot:1258204-Rhodomonas_salina.1